MPYKRFLNIALCLVIGPAVAGACTDVGDYSTNHGECYEGGIIAAEFVRSKKTFRDDLRLELTLDADALGSGKEGATITTNDGTFNRAPVSQMTQLVHDSLSLLQFPDGRMRNYLANALPNDGSPATVVISLMENDEVEVRIMRPDLTPYDNEDSSLFGVFRLIRKDGCSSGVIDE